MKTRQYNIIHTFNIALIFIGCVVFAAYADDDTLHIEQNNNATRFADRLEWLSNITFGQDVRMFAGHGNTPFPNEFRAVYFLAAQTNINARIISYAPPAAFYEHVTFGMRYMNELGAGLHQDDRAMAFNPNAANYSIVPYFMTRINEIEYELGLDHRCFHKIDIFKICDEERCKDAAYFDWNNSGPYWKLVYLTATSTHIANFPLRWQAGAGYFVRELFGLDPLILSAEHDYNYMAALRLGYDFYTWRNMSFGAQHDFTMLAERSGDIYYVGKIELGANIRINNYSFGMFVNYNYELPNMTPFGSKDRLFEFGLRLRVL